MFVQSVASVRKQLLSRCVGDCKATPHPTIAPVILMLFILTLSVIQSQCASFYGLSYTKLPIQENKNRTQVEFRFKTHQADAFLFLAAGSSDYCLVYLENGQLAIRINFGLGETYLASDNLYLNDLRWHTAQVQQSNSQLSMKIDNKHTFLHQTRGNSDELNIKYGILLGAQDSFKGLYLGRIPSLRGCMDQVYFNHKDILCESFKHGITHNVSPESCDEEFAAGNNTTISFMHTNSFVIVPGLSHLKNTSNLSVQFDIKTISENAILIFNPSDNPYKKQYFVVELINGKIKFSLNDGTEEISAQSSVALNNSHWHHVETRINDHQMEILVNGQLESINTKRSLSSGRHYATEMYIGGISADKQSVALNYRLQSILIEQDVSLKGCLRNIRINSKSIGLFDAIATNKIRTGKCKWHFLCAEPERFPCIENSKCIQQDVNTVKCLCEQLNCVRPDFKHKTIAARTERLPTCHQNLKPLDVLEGSKATVNLQLVDQLLEEMDINATMVSFAQMPKYGWIEDISSKLIFDLNQDYSIKQLENALLRYTHNGQSAANDSIVLRMETKKDKFTYQLSMSHTTSRCIQRDFTIPITVRPASDAPNGHNQNTVKLKILKNSRKQILPSLLKLRHKENKSKKKNDEIVYKIVQIVNGGSSFFEKATRPNVPINEFKEEDLKNKIIQFVHIGNTTTSTHQTIQVTIQASAQHLDKASKDFKLVIEPFEMEANEQINTGLLMAHNTFALISSNNLSFIGGNKVGMDYAQMVKYELVSGPNFGSIQKLRAAPNHWANVTHFTQRQVDRAKIRYLHLAGKPKEDELRLKISFNKQTVRVIHFVVSFVDKLDIFALGTNSYNISEVENEIIITRQELNYQTLPVQTIPQEIIFTLLSVPSSGSLYLVQTSGIQAKLKISSYFTQNDINENRLLYVKNNSGYNTANSINQHKMDSFDFELTTISSNQSQKSTFSFNIQEKVNRYSLINNKISVGEGDKSIIDQSDLFFSTNTDAIIDSLVFNITKQPQHGLLQLLYPNSKNIMETFPKQISLHHLQQRRVVYLHDDSENDSDFFEFAISNSTLQTLYNGRFSIEIIMKNDNPPQRIVNKTFHVIRNNERIILDSDLKYSDPDVNTLASDIVFKNIDSPNGDFYYINNTFANSFTQEDINKGLIKFRHSGADTGTISFNVTDGNFFISQSFEVHASEPFINIANITALVVKYGENALLKSTNLKIDTNLFAKDMIVIKLLSEPMFGQILINDKISNQFTLQELEDELVEYESTIFEDELPLSKNDSFEFRIFSNSTASNGNGFVSKQFEFLIYIYPQSYFILNVINLNNSTVLEEKQVIIDPNQLLIEHSELKANEIVYEIIDKPKYGWIMNLKHNNDLALHNQENFKFTQEDVDNNLIIYQNKQLSNTSEVGIFAQYWDFFIFEVHNQIVKLTNLTYHIEIIPKLFGIIPTNITVNEGHRAILKFENLLISPSYYNKFVDEFIVVEEPKYGTISVLASSDLMLSAKSFSLEQLQNESIYYRQDSSEVERDWFTVVARSNSLDKESLPATVHITIQTINDEAPLIVNNSLIEVWQNDSVLITNQHLAAIDEDSSLQDILYIVSMPVNGYLVNIETNITIDKFSQKDINSRKIYFNHVGLGNGSFRFYTTDGKNYGDTGVFTIIVKTRKMSVDIQQKLLVTPGMQQSITRRHLQVCINDPSEEREYTFKIIKAPTYGDIVLEGFRNDSQKVMFFTQTQINENLVLYDQNVPINAPVVHDHVIFDIESANIPTLHSVHFIIEIAIESLKNIFSKNISDYINVQPLNVLEGKFAPITNNEIDLHKFLLKTKFDDKLFLKINSLPHYGIILKNGINVKVEELFPLSDLFNGSIVYKHDDSNTFNDTIELNFVLENNFVISLINFSLPIEIEPVNDEFPKVINRSPRLKAIIASRTLVSNQVLNARDNDGIVSNIIFQFKKDNFTKESYFVVLPDDSPVYQFSQEDINNNKVYYIHNDKKMQHVYMFRVKDDPSIECSTDDVDVFYEQLSNPTSDSHCTQYYPLTVMVTQLELQFVNHTTIQMIQGSYQAGITKSHLATLSQRASPNYIIYKITKGPFHGVISVDSRINQREFSQQDVNNNLVYYVQKNMSAEDFFIVDISQHENTYYEKSVYDVEVKITTQPMIKALKPFLVAFPGQQSLLSYEYLDASELSIKTSSNPKFRIISQPKYGFFKILKFGDHISIDEKSNEVLKEFSQEDIVRNRVAYVADTELDLSYPNEMLIDIVNYELSASGVQNAYGIFVVNIFINKSLDQFDSENVLSTNTYFADMGQKLTNETLLIIFISIISLVVIILFFVFCKVFPSIFNVKSNESCHKNDSIKTLPRNVNLDNCLREYSDSTIRQTDCSTHSSSSNSLFEQTNRIQHVIQPSISPSLLNRCGRIDSRMLKENLDNYSSQLLTMLRSNEFNDKNDDFSPLPPPSLYFINDSSSMHEEQPLGNDFRHGMNELSKKQYLPYKHCSKQRDEPCIAANRSSGDGTSLSNSPYYSRRLDPKTKSQQELSEIDQYLSRHHNRDETFCTLDNKRCKVKSSHSQFKNQYWI